MKKIRNTIYAGALVLAFSAFAQDDLWGDANFDNTPQQENPAPAAAPAQPAKPAPKPAPVQKVEPAPAPAPEVKPAPTPAPAPEPAPEAAAATAAEEAPVPQEELAPEFTAEAASVEQVEPVETALDSTSEAAEPVAEPAPEPTPVQQVQPEPAPEPAPVQEAPAPTVQPAEKAAETIMVDSSPKADPAQKDASSRMKHFWLGLTVAGTYNDFWDSDFGFGNIESGDSYRLKIDGTDEVMSNYWGLGANAGISSLFLLNSYVGIRADVAFAARRGDGESDITVKLYWNDEERQPEKSDIKMKYYVRQMNIDVPLALRVVLPAMAYVEAGPLMSFNLYSKTNFSVTDIYGTEAFKEHDCFKIFEFAVLGGIGVMRPIGGSMLDVGLRFVLGITPLSDADDSPKTWQGQLNIAYWFI